MPKKTLQVQVQLDIQAVTCPGVWLCPNGKVSLQIFMLDSYIQTTALRPIFPLLYHEKFAFYKTFHAAKTLGDLQGLINKECLYAELIQWQNCNDTGNVLASFQTSLNNVLYPTTTYDGVISGIDVDLLMEPSKCFPGIIAPKIEISTRTSVEEIVCANDQYVVNPKVVTSDQSPCKMKHNQIRQRKVCHSLSYHKSRKCGHTRRTHRPPFVFRKVDEELLARKPQAFMNEDIDKCKCRSCSQSMSPEKKVVCLKLTKVKPKDCQCLCGGGRIQENCPLCVKYDHYFEGDCHTLAKGKCKNLSSRDSYVHRISTSSPTREVFVRSPVRTLKKVPIKTKPPAYYSPTLQDMKTCCNCSVTSSEDHSVKKMCYYCSPIRKKQSLAKQIHERLKQTLDCMPSYYFSRYKEEEGDSERSWIVECKCPSYRDCNEGFYRNLGKFYRNLHRC